MNRSTASICIAALYMAGMLPSFGQGQGSHPAFPGQKKMAIIMLSWSDRAAPASRQQVVDRMWNDPKSARNYFMDLSRGMVEFVLPAGSTGGIARS